MNVITVKEIPEKEKSGSNIVAEWMSEIKKNMQKMDTQRLVEV